MTPIKYYECYSPGGPVQLVAPNDSWRARKWYAWRNRCSTVDVIAREVDPPAITRESAA